MLIGNKGRMLFGATVCLLLACAQNTVCQTADERVLSRDVKRLVLREANALVALSKIANLYGAPIGLEAARGGSDGPPISLEVYDVSLRDALDAVTAQDSRYKWRVVDGVINVFPARERDEFVERLLEVRVRQFAVEKGAGLWDIRVNITNLPEVKTVLEDAKILPMIASWTNADHLEAGAGFSLDMTGASVREILNEIVRKSDAKYWVVNRYRDNADLLTLNFSPPRAPRL